MSLPRLRQAMDPPPPHPYADTCGWCGAARARFPTDRVAGKLDQGIRIVAVCPNCDCAEQKTRPAGGEWMISIVGPPIMIEYIRKGYR